MITTETRTAAPSRAARELIQELHDEMRADIPTFKIMGKSLLPPPWTQDRVDGVAVLLDEAIDSRLAALVQIAVQSELNARGIA